jgi:hypothetical protein
VALRCHCRAACKAAHTMHSTTCIILTTVQINESLSLVAGHVTGNCPTLWPRAARHRLLVPALRALDSSALSLSICSTFSRATLLMGRILGLHSTSDRLRSTNTAPCKGMTSRRRMGRLGAGADCRGRREERQVVRGGDGAKQGCCEHWRNSPWREQRALKKGKRYFKTAVFKEAFLNLVNKTPKL